MPSQRELFLRSVAQTSPFPLGLEIVKAGGLYLIDRDGKKYMDLIAGIGVSCLGHGHPAVVDAVKRQADAYLHTLVYGEFILSPQVALASLLTEHLPPSLNNVYFTNSGTEATEGAMKLAKRATGRRELISCFNAYHGSTQGAMSLNSEIYFTQAFRPLLPGVRHIRYNDFQDLDLITDQTAAVFVETVQGEAGVIAPIPGYLQNLRKKCTETGALLVLDEIQCGMGRTGFLWAFEKYGIAPDVLLLAKGLGGGMPIGAFIASRELMQALTADPVLGHITTFGGHPVSCAAALATLQTLLATDLIAAIPEKEQLFLQLLSHPAIREVRSAGLWLAVELRDAATVQAVIAECLSQGLLTDWFLFNDRSLRIAPPLVISEAEIRQSCDILLNALHKNSLPENGKRPLALK